MSILRFRCTLQICYVTRLRARQCSTEFGKVFQSIHNQHSWSGKYLQSLQHTCGKDVSAWERVLDSLAKEGKYKHAASVVTKVTEMKLEIIKTKHTNFVLEACIQGKDSNFAFDYFAMAPLGAVDGTSYRMVLVACGATGDYGHAQKVLEIMRERGVKIWIDGWNAVLNAYAEGNNLQGAMQAMSDMQKIDGLKPELSSYNRLLKACSRTGALCAARDLVQDMTALGLKPDSFTWSALVQTALKCDDLSSAVEIFDRVPSTSLTPHLFNHMMTAYSKKKNFDMVDKYFTKMKDAKVKGDQYTYSIMISYAVDMNRIDSIFHLVSEMVGLKIPLSHQCWRVALAPFGRDLDHEGTRSLMNRIRSAGGRPTVYMWRDFLGILGRQNQLVLAHNSLSDMMLIDRVAPDESCYLRVIRAYSESTTYNSWIKQHGLLTEMREKHKILPSKNAWRYVLTACAATNENIGDLFQLLAEMQNIDGHVPDGDIWTLVVGSLNSKGQSSPHLSYKHATSSSSARDSRASSGRDHYQYSRVVSQRPSLEGKSSSLLFNSSVERDLLKRFLKSCPTTTRCLITREIVKQVLDQHGVIKAYQLFKSLQHSILSSANESSGAITTFSDGGMGEANDCINDLRGQILWSCVRSSSSAQCEEIVLDMFNDVSDSRKQGSALPPLDAYCWTAMCQGYSLLGHAQTGLSLGNQLLKMPEPKHTQDDADGETEKTPTQTDGIWQKYMSLMKSTFERKPTDGDIKANLDSASKKLHVHPFVDVDVISPTSSFLEKLLQLASELGDYDRAIQLHDYGLSSGLEITSNHRLYVIQALLTGNKRYLAEDLACRISKDLLSVRFASPATCTKSAISSTVTDVEGLFVPIISAISLSREWSAVYPTLKLFEAAVLEFDSPLVKSVDTRLRVACSTGSLLCVPVGELVRVNKLQQALRMIEDYKISVMTEFGLTRIKPEVPAGISKELVDQNHAQAISIMTSVLEMYKAALFSCEVAGKADDALWVLERMRSIATYIKPDAECWSSIVKALCAADRNEEARDALLDMTIRDGAAPAPELWTCVLKNFAQQGNSADCLRTIAHMRTAAATLSGGASSVSSGNHLGSKSPSSPSAKSLQATGPPVSSALSARATMAQTSPSVDHWELTIMTLLGKRMSTQALASVHEMLQIDNIQPNFKIVKELIDQFALDDRPSEIIQILELLAKKCPHLLDVHLLSGLHMMKRSDLVLEAWEDLTAVASPFRTIK